jgi:hypothetical protein
LKTRPDKWKMMKNQTQSEKNLSSSDTTRNAKEKEQCKEKKYFNPYKEDLSPVESQFCYEGKTLYG